MRQSSRGTTPPRPTQRPAVRLPALPSAGAPVGRAGFSLLGADRGRGRGRRRHLSGLLTLREERAIRAEKARALRRLKRGLPLTSSCWRLLLRVRG
jgi:hypothetical protein